MNFIKNLGFSALGLIVGFLMCKSCSYQKSSENSSNQVITVRDSIFVPIPADTVTKYDRIIRYKWKTQTIVGEPKTIEVKVPVIDTKYKNVLVKDITAQDSIKSLLKIISRDSYLIDSLDKRFVITKTTNKKEFTMKQTVVSRGVDYMETEVLLKERVHFYPTITVEKISLTAPINLSKYSVIFSGQFTYKKTLIGVGYGVNNKSLVLSAGYKLF
jgi:hypothetical protein